MFILLTALCCTAVLYALYQSLGSFWAERHAYQNARHHAHKTLHDQVLRQALQEADAAGLGGAFRAYVSGVMVVTGQVRLQVGQLLWIFEQLEQGKRFDPAQPVPRFTKA